MPDDKPEVVVPFSADKRVDKIAKQRGDKPGRVHLRVDLTAQGVKATATIDGVEATGANADDAIDRLAIKLAQKVE